MQKQNKEIGALISLLDDTDKEVHEHVVERLSSFGVDIVPTLEDAWENSGSPDLQKKIEDLIHKIQFDAIVRDLKKWAESNSDDLLQGALIVARYQYNNINGEEIRIFLEQVKKDIWLELNEGLTALEKIKVFNHVFYDVYGFSGNVSNYLDPQNSYINIVVESKKGNPISLGALYLVLAKELGLPIFGVDLPQHFIMAYLDKDEMNPSLFEEEEKEKILFYINPFNKGTIFTEKEIYAYLNKLNIESKLEDGNVVKRYFHPSSEKTVIRLLIQQLIASYESLGENKKVAELSLLLDSIPDEFEE